MFITMSHKSLTHMAHYMDPSRFIPKYRQPTSHANKIDAMLSKNISTLLLVRLDAAPSGNIDNLFMMLSMDPFRLLPKYRQPTQF